MDMIWLTDNFTFNLEKVSGFLTIEQSQQSHIDG
ncbi:hypothetical protein JOC36_000905 [Weissella uvarum]|nr:hypothetical protein [Weissella uvarum]